MVYGATIGLRILNCVLDHILAALASTMLYNGQTRYLGVTNQQPQEGSNYLLQCRSTVLHYGCDPGPGSASHHLPVSDRYRRARTCAKESWRTTVAGTHP